MDLWAGLCAALMLLTGCDGSSGADAQVLETGQPGSAPVIDSTPVNTAVVGAEYRYSVSAKDADGPAGLRFSLPRYPDGMSIDPVTGLVAWTPADTQLGAHAVRVLVTDPQGLTGVQDYSLTVEAAPVLNSAPTITSSPVTAGIATVAYEYAVTATDPDDGDNLSFSLDVFPSGMNIDSASGLIAWTPETDQLGRFDVTVRVSDSGGLFDLQSFAVTVSEPAANRAPTITSSPVTSASVDTVYQYQLTATDPDAGDTLRFSLALAPAGFSIDEASGLISGTPAVAGTGDFDVRVSDPDGASDRQIFLLQIDAAADDQPPVLSPIPDQAVAVGASLDYAVSASDPEGASLRYRLDAAPSGLVINAANGALHWTPGDAQQGTSAVTVTVSDPGGQSDSQAFTVTVGERQTNNAPVLEPVSDQSVDALDALEIQLAASDPDLGDVLRFDLSGAAANYQIDTRSGTIYRRPGSEDVGTQSLTARVTDSAGASSSQTFQVSVLTPPSETEPPVAVDDRYVMDRRQILDVAAPGVLGNDRDGDTPASGLKASLVDDVLLGTLGGPDMSGGFTYTPPLAAVNEPVLQLKCQGTPASNATLAVADVDGDGDTEIVYARFQGYRGGFAVLNGSDCSVQKATDDAEVDLSGGLTPETSVALLDIDADGDLEIIGRGFRYPVEEGGDFDELHLVAMRHDGGLAWRSEEPTPLPNGDSLGLPSGLGPVLYDLDGDGVVEVLAKMSGPAPATGAPGALIVLAYDSRDGSIVWQYDSPALPFNPGNNFPPIVADLDLDGSPEVLAQDLVLDHRGALEFHLGLPAGYSDAGTLKLAVANFDNDPYPEIVAYNDRGRYLFEHDGTLVWKVDENLSQMDSAITVADLDGDGRPEFAFITTNNDTPDGDFLAAYKADGSLIWSHEDIPELRINQAKALTAFGVTAFDANLDGADDLVFALRNSNAATVAIIDGRDGALITGLGTGGSNEGNNTFLTLADVDNDGAAEIVESSRNNIGNSWVRVYEGVSPLPPARSIRNQWFYRPTEVALDASVISQPTPPWLTPGQNSFLSVNTVAGIDPDTTDRFTYTASDDSATSDPANVDIVIATVNAPSIVSEPVLIASPGFDYRYGVLANDPDFGETFTYTLVNAPAGVTINEFGVISWTPAAGASGPQRVQVIVTDSQGNSDQQVFTVDVQPPVTVPALLGLDETQARLALSDAGLVAGAVINTYSDSVAAGQVVSQGIAAGSEQAPGTAIPFVISLGVAPVSVPSLTGLSVADAESRLAEFGLQAGNLSYANSEEIAKGRITAQQPAAASKQPAGTAVDLTVSGGPALRVSLAKPIIEAGTDVALTVEVFDTQGQPIDPQAAIDLNLSALPGASGAAPEIAVDRIRTSADTRGGFTLSIEGAGYGSQEIAFSVRGTAGGGRYYGPIARFGETLEDLGQTYREASTALASGDTAAAMTAAQALVALRSGVDLDTLRRRTPFVAEHGFIPEAADLLGAGFPIDTQADPAVGAGFDALESALEALIAALDKLDPGDPTDDELRLQVLNSQLAEASAALLDLDLDTSDLVYARSRLHVLMSVLIPQLVTSGLDASITALQDAGVIAQASAPMRTPADFYARSRPAFFTVGGLMSTCTTSVSLAKSLYLPLVIKLTSSALVLAQADALQSFDGVQEPIAIITTASQSFHNFYIGNSVIELISNSGDTRNYTVELIGPDLYTAAYEQLTSIEAENVEDAIEAVEGAYDAISGGNETTRANGVERGCLFDTRPNCVELILGAGFPSVYEEGPFPASVLIMVTDHSRGGEFYVGVYAFFSTPKPED